MESKINLSIKLALFFMLTCNTIHCMKRTLANARIPQAKRIKRQEESPENRLLYLKQEYAKIINQTELLNAIEQKDISRVSVAVKKQSGFTFLDWTVATRFWNGMLLILEHGKPTQPELRRSLEIAIRTENISLMQTLLRHSAHLDVKNKADSAIKNILHKNPAAREALIKHGLTFINAINMDLTIETINDIIEKTNPRQPDLDRALQYATKKNYIALSYLLVAAK